MELRLLAGEGVNVVLVTDWAGKVELLADLLSDDKLTDMSESGFISNLQRAIEERGMLNRT